MNKTFNISRFSRLFYKHTVEHYKSYLMALTALFGVMVLEWGFFSVQYEVRFFRWIKKFSAGYFYDDPFTRRLHIHLWNICGPGGQEKSHCIANLAFHAF